MKKFALALLVAIMTVATASIAAAEVTVGGNMEVRYDVWTDLSLNEDSTISDSQNFFDQRVLLNVDAKLADGVEVFTELDTSGTSSVWGQDNVFGVPSLYLNHQDNSLNIKQAWINFMIPGVPVGMKIGHQPLALGHGIFLDTHRQGSDAILLYSKPIPELLVAGVYIKGAETSSRVPGALQFFPFGANHDADFYAALANYTWCENNTIGANITVVNDNNTIINNDINAINAMLTADGAMSGINYKAEVDYLHINIENAVAAGTDFDVDAWAFMAGANTNVGPANLGLEFAYGTGTAFDEAVDEGHTYATPYAATSYNYAFLYNDKIGQGANGTGGGQGFGDGFGGFGLANTWYIKLSGNMPVMEKMTAGLDILWLNAVEQSTNVDALGRAIDQDTDLGWEIDANVAYKMYENLDLNVQGGVFIPGGWYDAVNTPNVAGTGIDTDTAYGAEVKLTAKF